MGFIRRYRVPGGALLLAFSLTSLAVLPTALCCQAVATTGARDQGDVCPHQQADGEACPMHRPQPVDGSGCRSFEACESPDALLAGLLTLTGAMPERAHVADAQTVIQPLETAPTIFIAPFATQPHDPPPRV